MELGMEVSLGPGRIVLELRWGPPLTQRGTGPIFGPCLLWPSGWIDQDAIWYGGTPRPRRHWVRWGPL